MKLTKTLVKNFENDQKEHGTQAAIYNLLWNKAYDDLKNIGVVSVKTSTTRRK